MITISKLVLNPPTRMISRRPYWAEAVYVQEPIKRIGAGDSSQALTNNCYNDWADELLPDGD